MTWQSANDYLTDLSARDTERAAQRESEMDALPRMYAAAQRRQGEGWSAQEREDAAYVESVLRTFVDA